MTGLHIPRDLGKQVHVTHSAVSTRRSWAGTNSAMRNSSDPAFLFRPAVQIRTVSRHKAGYCGTNVLAWRRRLEPAIPATALIGNTRPLMVSIDTCASESLAWAFRFYCLRQ